MKRCDQRESNEIRPVKILANYLKNPAGSVLMEMGETKVICTASIEESVPRWMKDEKKVGGWITAEYSMLPAASTQRTQREAAKGKVSGRTQEIQRLIGRSLRAIVDMERLGTRTIWIDCDVIQADGGTRTASITGSFVALRLAVEKLIGEGKLSESPIREAVAAVSVGMAQGKVLLDLCYTEDVDADVDMNVVMTRGGRYVEIQGTAEAEPFAEAQMKAMLGLAKKGIRELMKYQEGCFPRKGGGEK